MNTPHAKHVFISYVQEDLDRVDELCHVLKTAHVPYWRDRESLGPGDAWREKIRDAIRNGAMIFLACFSENSAEKAKSYMNEEIHLAIEEYRKLAPGQTWIIPVRLDDMELPAWELSAGRTLSDINYVNFFGNHKPAAAVQLTQKLGELMGANPLTPDQIQAAVQSETPEDRARSLSKLTKDMLLDPQKRIELDDLVAAEIQKLLLTITDVDINDAFGQLQQGPERTRFAAERAEHLAREAAPFCATLQIAARFASSEQLEPWATGINELVRAANAERAGYEAINKLRHIPAVLAIMTVALSTIQKKKWDNLKALVADQSVTIPPYYRNIPESILDATGMYKAFEPNIPNLLLWMRRNNMQFDEAIRERRKFRTPQADYFHTILRPWFAELIPADNDYDTLFDQAEVILGLLSTDEIITNQTPEDENYSFPKRTHWFGRAPRRIHGPHPNPITTYKSELERQLSAWPPLQAGLFGGSTQRAEAALNEYSELFEEISKKYW